MNTQPRRTWEILIGLFFLVAGLAAFASESFPALMLILLGGALLWRQYNQNANFDISSLFSSTPRRTGEALDEEPYFPEEDDLPRQAGSEKIYAHALRAVERAGLSPDELQVLPVDIGLMVFKSDLEPVIYRNGDIPDDADYIQPFVQLRLSRRAAGRIKFELIDSDGQILFVHEEIHQLDRGRNLITPAARLPIHDAQALRDNWQLRISADGMPLATHRFGWQESDERAMRRHMTEDGEISNELRTALAENRLQRMSLDELLGDEEADDGAAASGRKASGR
ncbi:MAG: hypothetical protein JNM70_11785 [Anaerolineae bacterium]|nr:hypothetical protein [Anaerolineae bacterium]